MVPRFIPLVFLAFAVLGWSDATEQRVYTYTGEPIMLPAECSNELMESLGLFCPADSPCPVYLQLSSVEFVQGKLFLAGNLHTQAVTISSVLLASDDGGLTWREAAERIPQAALDRVVFYDEEHGWAAGHILDGGRPRDPFFLLTTDGGRFWRRRPVFDDARPAVIEDFWFDSDRSGILLIKELAGGEAGAQYTQFETMTGAESWMIREVSSRPIRVRRRPAPRTGMGWRIEADGTRGVWQVQKRTESGWANAVEFLIDSGACAAVEEERLAEGEAEAEAETAAVESERAGESPAEDKGVFVIGSPPPAATRPAQKPADDEKRPTLKKPRP